MREVRWGPAHARRRRAVGGGHRRSTSPTSRCPTRGMWERRFVLAPLADLAPDLATPAEVAGSGGRGAALASAPRATLRRPDERTGERHDPRPHHRTRPGGRRRWPPRSSRAGWDVLPTLGRGDDLGRRGRRHRPRADRHPRPRHRRGGRTPIEPVERTVVAHVSGSAGLHPLRPAPAPGGAAPARRAARCRAGRRAPGRARGSGWPRTATRWSPRSWPASGAGSCTSPRPEWARYHAAAVIASNHLVALLGPGRAGGGQRRRAGGGVPRPGARQPRRRRRPRAARRAHRTGPPRRHRHRRAPPRRPAARGAPGLRGHGRGGRASCAADAPSPRSPTCATRLDAARAARAARRLRADDGLPPRRARLADGRRPSRAPTSWWRRSSSTRCSSGPPRTSTPTRATSPATRPSPSARASTSCSCPSGEEMYPDGAVRTSVTVAEVSEPLEGRARPTHFAGVATVVAKLFAIVGPVPRLLRREGLPAGRGRPPDGARPVDPRRRRRLPHRSASPTAWPCRAATPTSPPEERAAAPVVHAALQVGPAGHRRRRARSGQGASADGRPHRAPSRSPSSTTPRSSTPAPSRWSTRWPASSASWPRSGSARPASSTTSARASAVSTARSRVSRSARAADGLEAAGAAGGEQRRRAAATPRVRTGGREQERPTAGSARWTRRWRRVKAAAEPRLMHEPERARASRKATMASVIASTRTSRRICLRSGADRAEHADLARAAEHRHGQRVGQAEQPGGGGDDEDHVGEAEEPLELAEGPVLASTRASRRSGRSPRRRARRRCRRRGLGVHAVGSASTRNAWGRPAPKRVGVGGADDEPEPGADDGVGAGDLERLHARRWSRGAPCRRGRRPRPPRSRRGASTAPPARERGLGALVVAVDPREPGHVEVGGAGRSPVTSRRASRAHVPSVTCSTRSLWPKRTGVTAPRAVDRREAAADRRVEGAGRDRPARCRRSGGR